MKKVTIKIYGKVQGVSFRYFAEEEANKLKIESSRRNEPDGSVYIEAHGPEQAIEQFIEWCRKGPSEAKVERIELEWGSVDNEKR